MNSTYLVKVVCIVPIVWFYPFKEFILFSFHMYKLNNSNNTAIKWKMQPSLMQITIWLTIMLPYKVFTACKLHEVCQRKSVIFFELKVLSSIRRMHEFKMAMKRCYMHRTPKTTNSLYLLNSMCVCQNFFKLLQSQNRLR